MERIKWDDAWTLGHDEVDAQHKNLIDILNNIISRKHDIITTLNDLIEYTAIHFIDEENLMISNHYPESKIHTREHNKFKLYLLDLSFDIISIKDKADATDIEKLTVILERFVYAWFRQHFLEVDKPLINYINSGGD